MPYQKPQKISFILHLGSWILTLLVSFFWFLPSTKAQGNAPKANVLIINQVRGTECCDPGSLESLKTQVETMQNFDLPGFFVLRYDALNDEVVNYALATQQYSNTAINFGLFIEITPSLAHDADINYHGTEENWYQAQNALTLGYTNEERIKIVDQLFKTFHDKFGFYPELTSAWMIDTSTLNYIHEKYGVKVHQITREQWGTDSYTLYGGPEHYPYPASQNWLFLPDYQAENTPLIVRQTVTDPLNNYGDQSSSYTSQPNDYMQDGKTIDYFKRLINQALFEQTSDQEGFALIGLENSMDQKYQDEYIAQLQFVAELSHDDKKSINIVSDLDSLNLIYKDNLINVYHGSDIASNANLNTEFTQQQVYWVDTQNYRLRLRFDNNYVYIDDYRIFPANLEDPYSSKSAQNRAFWITPFIIDGSRWPKDRSFLEEFYLKYPWWKDLGLQAHPDTNMQTTRLKLPDQEKNSQVVTNKSNDEFSLEYQAINKKIKLIFNSQEVNFQSVGIEDFVYQNFTPKNFPIQLKKDNSRLKLEWGNGELGLEIECQADKTCNLSPYYDQKTDWPEFQSSTYLFPESNPIQELKAENLEMFFNNQYAIAGRNPIRIVFITKNDNKLPSIYKNQITVKTENEKKPLSISEISELQNGVYFFDITSEEAQSAKIFLQFNDQKNPFESEKMNLIFAPNCKEKKTYCMTHPKQAIDYLFTLVRDKLRKTKE